MGKRLSAMSSRLPATPVRSSREPSAESRGRSLTSPAFVVAVALLLLNDWVLKPTLHNWLTGKLSDLAGLFAFALFWTALLPRRRDAVFALTAVGFLLWKSPLSSAPLAAWNALGLWPLARVVDYTDWVALAALLPAYRLARRDGRVVPIRAPRLRRRLAAVATAGAAMAAFMATSRAVPSHDLHDPTGWLVPAARREVRAGLRSLGLAVEELPSERVAERRGAPVDTLRVYIRQPPERDVGVKIEVRELAPQESRIRLIAASADGPEPEVDAVRRAFEQQAVEPLRLWIAQRVSGR